PARLARELRDVCPRARDGARRPLPDPAQNRDRAVHGRGGRPRTARAAVGGARAAARGGSRPGIWRRPHGGARARGARCEVAARRRSVNVTRSPGELERVPRAVALGTFDGVHVGHGAVVGRAVTAGPRPTVVTFHPHPREVLGNRVRLLASLERRLELLAALGVDDTLVVEFTPELAQLGPEEFARVYLDAIGARLVVAGPAFRFGRGRSGDLALLR